jgi:DNA topoisomerase-1
VDAHANKRRNPRIARRQLDAGPATPEPPPELSFQLDWTAGIRRRRGRGSFRYVSSTGKTIRDARILRRIRALAIPPAWSDVWIAKEARGHLQATGRDARGRKQYRYHPRWRQIRNDAKFEHIAAFAKALPALRERVQRDLARPNGSRDRVLAAIVRLLELTLSRVGNEEYARDNASFGLTTLRCRHVQVEGAKVRFEFRGKGNKRHRIAVSDRRLANVVRHCRAMRGRELFQYVDDGGRRRRAKSPDVNAYIREATGGDFTAKDFRTWAGTVLAAVALSDIERPENDRLAKRGVMRAIESVAEALGNTPAVCRKSYVHPAVIDAFMSGSLKLRASNDRGALAVREGLSAAERQTLTLLRRHGIGNTEHGTGPEDNPAPCSQGAWCWEVR